MDNAVITNPERHIIENVQLVNKYTPHWSDRIIASLTDLKATLWMAPWESAMYNWDVYTNYNLQYKMGHLKLSTHPYTQAEIIYINSTTFPCEKQLPVKSKLISKS